MNARLSRSQPSNSKTTQEQEPLLHKPTSNPAVKCFNFEIAKQELVKQRATELSPAPPKPQPGLPSH